MHRYCFALNLPKCLACSSCSCSSSNSSNNSISDSYHYSLTGYKGNCTNGTLIIQEARVQDDHCGKCDRGYSLVGMACVGYGGTCENGNLTGQADRTKDDHCGECNDGYTLDNMACKGGTRARS